MDTVDTFNHLIPSDQLDDSLIIGQNLECEANNEFGTRIRLDDSLKNMLSDKDPMFGCASAQFNLLENEDPAFQIAGTASPGSGSAPAGLNNEDSSAADTSQVKHINVKQKKYRGVSSSERSHGDQPRVPTNTLIRGKPRRKPVNRIFSSFLIQKGVIGPQLKKELILGGRVNVNDLYGGLWLNPTVVLRRLTVTIGGFKIELLPGPSYMQGDDPSQSMCFDSSFPYDGNIGLAILPDDSVHVEHPLSESLAQIDGRQMSSTDDVAHGLGPYVNPNDVQTSNGNLSENTGNDQRATGKRNIEGKDGVKCTRRTGYNSLSLNNNTASKGKQTPGAKTQFKPKQGVNRGKESVMWKTGNTKVLQNKPSKVLQTRELHKTREKQEVTPLKRPAENVQSEHLAKVAKLLGAGDGKLKPKSPSGATKKVPSPGNRIGDHPGGTKQNNPHPVPRLEPAQQSHAHPSNSLQFPQEGVLEKFRPKKPEKILQKQKSKSGRSVSVDEPQLFVPDNAPAAKKEAAEEQLPNSDSVWDGNNCCGLCKKHHNNMFMVGCGRCDDWFHGDCVGLDLAKVHEMEEEDQMYVCLKCCDEESKKAEPPAAAKTGTPEKTEVDEQKMQQKPRPGSSQILSSGGVRPVRKDPERRLSSDIKDSFYKTGNHSKHEMKSKAPALASKKPISVDAIRRNVRDSLKEILLQRLKESDLKISSEKASEVAKKTERELFHLYKDTDNKYKNKYRSLTFNLKDTKNNILFKKVLRGEISPGNLIRMSPEELASKELAAWRQRENRHTIEMIEKEQREVERRPITKITHKGEIEIESQEPTKAPDPIELEPPPRVTEIPAEAPKSPEEKTEDPKVEKDTTSQHKSHLFDLHCKICTGRMAPPVEEAPTKVVKVATTVVRRQSAKTEETKSTTPAGADDELRLSVLEESLRTAKSGYEARSNPATGKEEAAFLANLKFLWRGFIHMHSVAKLVTKAFPVSGILDNLTEDLPDSIQVGGRISPQTVWDYLEKIRATGTKEVCLVRFAPETEEDEISYTLLYAYFSSRRRFGVVSNNLKQVKDMYLIPLPSTEKVPHQLVPFDGPGLENNRANLLLGLLIRQRPKRDFIPVDVNETARIVPEIKPIVAPLKSTPASEKEEKLYLSTLAPSHKKETSKVDEEVLESSEEPPAAEESGGHEPLKPLRFLPGVLVGWGGELPPLPQFGDDAPKSQPAPKRETSPSGSKSGTATAPRFIIKKKEVKPVKAEPEATKTPAPHNSSGKEAEVVSGRHISITLKDKPPDVSTEAFLTSLAAAQTSSEPAQVVSVKQSSEELQSESRLGSDPTNCSKSLSGILKKPLTNPTANEEKQPELRKDPADLPDPSKAAPAPSSSSRKEPVLPFHQGYLQLFQARHKPEEHNQTAFQSLSAKSEAGTNPDVSKPLHDDASAHISGTASSSSQQEAQASDGHLASLSQSEGTSSTENLSSSFQSSSLDSPKQSDPEASEHASPPARDHRRSDEQYSDPWERPLHAEEREHYGKHDHHRDGHHSKRNRHHNRERKHEHSYEEKHRERSRHHGHSNDRHGERRRDRHSEDHRDKDRHRHRRDSDFENGRRSSKDGYS